jgi:hypothetical protein
MLKPEYYAQLGFYTERSKAKQDKELAKKAISYLQDYRTSNPDGVFIEQHWQQKRKCA